MLLAAVIFALTSITLGQRRTVTTIPQFYDSNGTPIPLGNHSLLQLQTTLTLLDPRQLKEISQSLCINLRKIQNGENEIIVLADFIWREYFVLGYLYLNQFISLTNYLLGRKTNNNTHGWTIRMAGGNDLQSVNSRTANRRSVARSANARVPRSGLRSQAASVSRSPSPPASYNASSSSSSTHASNTGVISGAAMPSIQLETIEEVSTIALSSVEDDDTPELPPMLTLETYGATTAPPVVVEGKVDNTLIYILQLANMSQLTCLQLADVLHASSSQVTSESHTSSGNTGVFQFEVEFWEGTITNVSGVTMPVSVSTANGEGDWKSLGLT